jgi:hypothetical protein
MSAFPSQAARKQDQNVTRFLPARPHEALARSPLNATEKQLMFNELWG